MDDKEFDMMKFFWIGCLCYKLWCVTYYTPSSIKCNFDSTASRTFFSNFCQTCTGICFTCSVIDYFWLDKNGFQQEWFSNDFFGFLSFSDFILLVNLLNPSLYANFFHFFKKHAEEDDLRYETSTIVVVIVVLKSNFFYFKTIFPPDFPSFIFKVNHVLIEEEDNPSKKLI